MSKTKWAGVTGDAISSFEELRRRTSFAYNSHWLEWIRALKLFVSRADPTEVITALEMCKESQPLSDIHVPKEQGTDSDISV